MPTSAIDSCCGPDVDTTQALADAAAAYRGMDACRVVKPLPQP